MEPFAISTIKTPDYHAEGMKLATSNDLKSNQNIGFPSEVTGLAHFEHMLKSTRQRLTDVEITDLIRMLKTEEE